MLCGPSPAAPPPSPAPLQSKGGWRWCARRRQQWTNARPEQGKRGIRRWLVTESMGIRRWGRTTGRRPLPTHLGSPAGGERAGRGGGEELLAVTSPAPLFSPPLTALLPPWCCCTTRDVGSSSTLAQSTTDPPDPCPDRLGGGFTCSAPPRVVVHRHRLRRRGAGAAAQDLAFDGVDQGSRSGVGARSMVGAPSLPLSMATTARRHLPPLCFSGLSEMVRSTNGGRQVGPSQGVALSWRALDLAHPACERNVASRVAHAGAGVKT